MADEDFGKACVFASEPNESQGFAEGWQSLPRVSVRAIADLRD
jgi:hypothetical protein